MFRTRWRSDRNKIKAVFRLQFNATQVPQPGWDALVVSLVPLDSGKPTAKSEKAVVLDGVCCWEKAIFETVKISKEPRTGRIGEKVYRFVISANDSPKSAILGEASFDFASYAEVVKPSLVSLPLRTSNCNPILHLTIQRVQDDVDGREAEENEISQKKRISQLSNHGANDSISSTEEHTSSSAVALQIESNGSLVKSGSFDALSVSESDNGSEQYTPLQNSFKDPNSFLSPLRDNISSQTASANSKNSVEECTDHRRSTTECSVTSAPDASSDGSTNSSEDTGLRERLQRPDMTSEQLKKEIALLARQVEVSELELQALRKLVVKDKRQGEDLTKELCLLRDEKDALRRKCELLKASELNIGIGRVQSLRLDGEDLKLHLEEMKQELKHEKNLNASLHLQLQKTHESNNELILAVKDLEELLDQKNRELCCSYCKQISVKLADDDNSLQTSCVTVNDLSSERQREGSKELLHTFSECEDDEELEVLAKENAGFQVEYSLEQKVVELTEEIDLYKKDRDYAEMQMEQLALDFEIIKQENHDLSSRLEQSQLREQLKMQYECSAHTSIISDLEAHVENLEKELEQQAELYEADLTHVVSEKIEQERRAIRAEETLRQCKLNNASTAEKLQEEFKRLSAQMSSVFNANEKLAKQAMVEASELRLQKTNLEESLEKANERLTSTKYQYTAQIHELLRQIDLKIEDVNELQVKLKNNHEELEDQKKSEEAMRKDLAEEISTLKVAIEVLSQENSKLSDRIKEEQNLMVVLEQERSKEKCELDAQLACMRIQADKSKEEISNLKQLKDEEATIRSLTSEIEELRKQCSILNKSLVEDVLEKEGLKNRVLRLKGDSQKKEETITLLQNKLKDNKNSRATLSDGRNNSKSSPCVHGSKELAHLHEKVTSLQEDLRFKEDEMGNLMNAFSEKENNLSSRIEELENGSHHLQYSGETTSVCNGNGASNNLITRNGTPDPKTEECLPSNSNHQIDMDASTQEVSLLKEKNESMENELKEMQERYSELSLRFAEVEGERQQLVMRARAIGRGGSEFIRRNLTMDYVYDYMFHLLNEYSKLLNYKPTVPPNAVEFCSETMACKAEGLVRTYMMDSMVDSTQSYGPCSLPPPYTPQEKKAIDDRNDKVIKQVEVMERHS